LVEGIPLIVGRGDGCRVGAVDGGEVGLAVRDTDGAEVALEVDDAQIEESYSHTTPASSLLGFDGLPLSIMSFIQSLLASLHADEHPKAIDVSVPVQRKPAYCVA